MPARRSRSNDLRAMEAYRRIHATLGERVVGPPADLPRNGSAGRPAGRGGGGRGKNRLAAPGRGAIGVPVARSSGRPGRRSRFANLDRPRPAGPVLTATAVIALLALLALALGRLVVGSGSTGPSRPAASRTSGAGRAAATHPAAAHPATAPRHTRSRPLTTGTTAPAPSVIAPRSVSAAGSDYVVPTASFSVDLDTSGGACWVEVGPSAAGPFTFVGTIPSGQHRVFPATSQLWIRLGAPGSVTVTVNGTPLQLTAPGSAPYNLTISAVGA